MKAILPAVLLLCLFPTSGFTQGLPAAVPNCSSLLSDSDGDGYGWENNQSCLAAGMSDPSGECEDRGDHPWGWNPVTQTSCLLADTADTADTADISICIDTDGDGYGWNGIETCSPALAVQNLTVENLAAQNQLTVLTDREIERFILVTTENEFRLTTFPLQKFPDGSTITYYIEGTPTAADLQTVDNVLGELSDLTNLVFVQINDLSAIIDIHFKPVATFPSFIPNFVSEVGVTGSAQFFSDHQFTIFDARVAMDTAVSQFERDHATREELTQVLGFTNDTFDEFDSIFHQFPNGVTEFSATDRKIIATMYTTGLTAGMTPAQIRNFLTP